MEIPLTQAEYELWLNSRAGKRSKKRKAVQAMYPHLTSEQRLFIEEGITDSEMDRGMWDPDKED